MERGSEARPEPERGPQVIEPSALPAYGEDGVDLTLIRWMLSLSPMERLRVLQSSLRAIRRVRDAAARS